jgi:hypothetical protein
MKLFDVDWMKVLADLQRWNALPLPARQLLLDELKTHGYVPAEKFGAQLDEIIASGIPAFDAERNRATMSEEYRALMKVLRALGRHPLFDAPSPHALLEYLEEHYTQTDIETLGTNALGHSRVLRSTMAARVAFAGWPGDLLAATSDGARLAWATSVGRPAQSMHTGRGLATLRALQQLVRQLVSSPGGVSLAELAQQSHDDLPLFAAALHLGLGTMVLFAAMRTSDLEPMIGLWPTAAAELTRPPTPPPSFVTPIDQFSLAVQMEDMTTVLAAIIAEPVRLRLDDRAVFARERAAIEPRLIPVPAWAEELVRHPQYNRVDLAARNLEVQGLVRLTQQHGNPHFVPTTAGAKWLMLSPHDRLATLAEPVRKSKDTNPAGGYYAATTDHFFPFGLPYYHAPKFLRLRQDLTRAFLQAKDGYVPLEQFLVHAEREANPFVRQDASEERELRHSIHSDGTDAREAYRNLWRSALYQFLAIRLVGLGGVSIGRLRTGELCFTLTGVGRYLLGVDKTFEYGTDEKADVVVQPNFDVVFLGIAPGTEALFARFAERAGVAPGLTFKLTRASVLQAAEQGMTTEKLMAVLRDASTKPIPKNVEREITGWMSSIRRARLRSMQVVECADEESTDRVAAVLGGKVRRLGPTMLEVAADGAAARAALAKRLRAAGIFLENV